MNRKFFFILITALLVAGCVDGPRNYMKRSANNKLFDTQGFNGGKRTPLYNKKYISKAKKNVVSGKYEDDEELLLDTQNEEENVALANREMYREMIQQDIEKRNRRENRWDFFGLAKKKNNSSDYPDITKAKGRMSDNELRNEHLRAELEQIKAMLNDTKREMSSYKCPTAEEIMRNERKKNLSKPTPNVLKNSSKDTSEDEPEDDNVGSSIVDPVQSI